MNFTIDFDINDSHGDKTIVNMMELHHEYLEDISKVTFRDKDITDKCLGDFSLERGDDIVIYTNADKLIKDSCMDIDTNDLMCSSKSLFREYIANNVKSLAVFGIYKKFTDYEYYNLENLLIDTYEPDDLSDFLIKLPSLKTLELINCNKIESLKNLPHLESLKVIDCRSLRIIDNLKVLKDFSVENCENFEVLNRCPKLRDFHNIK